MTRKLANPRRKPRDRYLDWEDNVIRKFYPDNQKLSELLPHRPMASFRHRAQVLGVSRKRTYVKTWKRTDIKKVRDMHRSGVTTKDIAASFPMVTVRSIEQIISRFCDTRKTKPYSGPDVIKSIREEAQRQGLYLTELDRKIGTSGYFGSGRKKLNAYHIVKAVEVLGGTFTIRWDEKPRPAVGSTSSGWSRLLR